MYTLFSLESREVKTLEKRGMVQLKKVRSSQKGHGTAPTLFALDFTLLLREFQNENGIFL